jgi:TetR/AcrR family transcriptional repressor of nem operon
MRMKVDRSPKPVEQFKRVLFATVLSTPAACPHPD